MVIEPGIEALDEDFVCISSPPGTTACDRLPIWPPVPSAAAKVWDADGADLVNGGFEVELSS